MRILCHYRANLFVTKDADFFKFVTAITHNDTVRHRIKHRQIIHTVAYCICTVNRNIMIFKDFFNSVPFENPFTVISQKPSPRTIKSKSFSISLLNRSISLFHHTKPRIYQKQNHCHFHRVTNHFFHFKTSFSALQNRLNFCYVYHNKTT